MNALALPVLALLIAGFIVYVASRWLRKPSDRALSTEALSEVDDSETK